MECHGPFKTLELLTAHGEQTAHKWCTGVYEAATVIATQAVYEDATGSDYELDTISDFELDTASEAESDTY